MDHAESISELKSTLEEVNSRLLDISMSILSIALERGERTRPPQEKQIAQARRAVERAIHALDGISSD